MEEKPMQHDSSAPFAPLDRQTFQSFYRENLGPIYRYVYGKVGNREEAEDLTSHIFIKAVRSLDRERTPQSTRSWLFRVARTTIADYWRAFYRTATSSFDALLEAGWQGPTEHEDEDRLFESSSSADHVQRLLQALPERDREILTSEEQVRDFFNRLGAFDHLVFTAGETLLLRELSATSKDWECVELQGLSGGSRSLIS